MFKSFSLENQMTIQALTQSTSNIQNNMENLDNPPAYNNLNNTESVNQTSPPSYINVINKI